MAFDYCYFSEKGPREVNQDAVFAATRGDLGVFALADGMGGHSDGEIASGRVIDEIKTRWESMDSDNIDAMADSFSEGLVKAGQELYGFYSERGNRGGSTAVVLLINKWDYRVLSVGDSRVYAFDHSDMTRVTEDDVWENLPAVKSALSPEEIRTNPEHGELTDAIGGNARSEIHRIAGSLKAGDGFLLCSDGVYRPCGDEALKKILCRRFFFKARNIAGKIRKQALDSGTKDNYSAIICRVIKG